MTRHGDTTSRTTSINTSNIHVIDFSKVSKNPLNPINSRLRKYIWDELQYAIRTPTITSIIIYGGGSSSSSSNNNSSSNHYHHFSAGADITEFATLTTTATASRNPTSSFVTTSTTTTTTTTTHHNNDVVIPSLVDIINGIDTCTKPIVACIAGICYGGGMEIVLACHYRIAMTSTVSTASTSTSSASTKFALPEIHVGVIPGAGGTQRLPRIIGLQKALYYILSGQSISVSQAFSMKLIDAIVDHNNMNDGTLLDVGKQWAQYATLLPIESRRISTRTALPDVTSPAQAHIMCHLASLSIPNITQSHIAIIDACRASVTSPTFQDGMKIESQLFLQVLNSVEGKARRHAFFAVRKAQKSVIEKQASTLLQGHPLLNDPKASIATTSKIEVAVIGAGTMGSGIAIAFLQAGYKVYIVDNSDAALQKGVIMVTKVFESYVTKKKISSKVKDVILSKQLFVPTKDLKDLKNCALIVEAIIENMSIKQNIFRQLNTILNQNHNDHCIVTSNTSTLDIPSMASVMDPHRQGQFAGLHFFSPAHIMQLVEIIHCNNPPPIASASSTSKIQTLPQTIAILQSITKRIGKIGVVVGNCDGFCGNRMLRPYSAETVLLLVESQLSPKWTPPTIEQVDYAIRNVFGMALGPFEMSDLAGNDIGYNIRKERGWVRLNNASDTVPAQRPSRYTELADDMVSQLQRHGQKVNKGWYDYDQNIGKGRKPLPSIEMSKFIQKYIEPPKYPTGATMTNQSNTDSMSDQEIIERVLYPLVNEGFKCLEEQIVSQPSDIDVVYIYGYGFPVTKGGPMYWADHIVTLPILLSKLQEFHHTYPTTDHYQPSQLLIDCVQSHMTLDEYWKITKTDKKEHQSNL